MEKEGRRGSKVEGEVTAGVDTGRAVSVKPALGGARRMWGRGVRVLTPSLILQGPVQLLGKSHTLAALSEAK